MTGEKIRAGSLRAVSLTLVAALGLSACNDTGGFSLGGAGTGADGATPAATRMVQTERDVERPDVFEVTDRGLWDGRPSLGGIWVAHPDVEAPERVIIRNPENGKSVVGALFRRERENPGPLLQVSSDAAQALDLLAGAPTELSVVALRREEIEVPEEAPENNPVLASLAAPAAVAATALDDDAPTAAAASATETVTTTAIDPIAGAAAAIAAAEADENPEAAVVQDASVVVGDATAPLAQIGVFSVEANANGAAQKIRDAGIAASVETQDAGGRTVWRVVAGPVSDDATLAKLKSLGFVDAFVLPSE